MPLFYALFSITSSITQTSLTNYMFSKIKLFTDFLVVKFLLLQFFLNLMVYICYQLGLRVGTRIFKRNSCLLVFYCVKLNFLVKIKTHVCFLWVFGIIKCWFCFVHREIECFTIFTTGDLMYHKSHRREFVWGLVNIESCRPCEDLF